MWMPQLPQPLRWDHNAHYHRWLLQQLPATQPRNVLDVGCGVGGLAAKLAARTGHVDAVDVSAPMITRARTRYATTGNIRWLVGDLLDQRLPLEHEGYDVVTAVSSLHHMPLRPALGRLAGLVRWWVDRRRMLWAPDRDTRQSGRRPVGSVPRPRTLRFRGLQSGKVN